MIADGNKFLFDKWRSECEVQTVHVHPTTDCTTAGRVTVLWGTQGIGFGEFVFFNKEGKLYCSSEGMSKNFIKSMLCKMVDDCELTD